MKLHFLNTKALLIGSIICSSLQANDMCVELAIPGFPSRVWIDISAKGTLPENFAQDMLAEEFTALFLNEHISEYQKNPTDVPALEKNITEEIQLYANMHGFKTDTAVLHAEPYNLNFTVIPLVDGGKIILAAKNDLTEDQINTLLAILTKAIEKNLEFMDFKASLEEKIDLTSKNDISKAEKAIMKKLKEVEKIQNDLTKTMSSYEILGFQIIEDEKTA